ncbi:hypothetical protein SCOR_15160 [Sulfidibacter corallicola]|uniref:PIN domain-containing protein n=1 Tax=Sulfidibacter corallicola TaxID=2818388 RepID=A0A8A4TXI6_SULCO|nr:hypothetical protein [Sulfidibacter corallicola]QTD54193.1 hypothetical protein J3U87_17240 [Sulfidibacter corallicola]
MDLAWKDKGYLLLQFKMRCYKQNAIEFQSFFEEVMEEVYDDFRKIRPHGNLGDGGNDGYRPSVGEYYQVYSPRQPQFKDTDAAKKFKDNFKTLKATWGEFDNVKTYYLVFNDKYHGSSLPLEKARIELKRENPDVLFDIVLARDFERLFLKLGQESLLRLDFDIDSRRAVEIVTNIFDQVKDLLKKGQGESAYGLLQANEIGLHILNDDHLLHQQRVLECRCLISLERIPEVKEKCQHLLLGKPEDIDFLCILMDLSLSCRDFAGFEEKLNQAKHIDQGSIRAYCLELECIMLSNGEVTDENLNYLYKRADYSPPFVSVTLSYACDYLGRFEEADKWMRFVENNDQDDLAAHLGALCILHSRGNRAQDPQKRAEINKELQEKSKLVYDHFSQFGPLSPRDRVLLQYLSIQNDLETRDYEQIINKSSHAISLVMKCYFDYQIAIILTKNLQVAELSKKILSELLAFLEASSFSPPLFLQKQLLLLFLSSNISMSEIKEYFINTQQRQLLSLLENIEEKRFEGALEELRNDLDFAYHLALGVKRFPEFRRYLYSKLPDLPDHPKGAISLILSVDEGCYEETLKFLQNICLDTLSYYHKNYLLKAVRDKKAWDIEIFLLEKLLGEEWDSEKLWSIKYRLIYLYYSSQQYLKVILLGEELLLACLEENVLTKEEVRRVLWATLQSCLCQGKVESRFFDRALDLLERFSGYDSSFDFLLNTKAIAEIKSNNPKAATETILKAIKEKGLLSLEDCNSVFQVVVFELGESECLSNSSLEVVTPDSFVKFKDSDKWYVMSESSLLEAVPVPKKSSRYKVYLGQRPNVPFIFSRKFSSETLEIERIFCFKNYAFWYVFQKIGHAINQDLIPGVVSIPVKKDSKGFDFGNLISVLKEERNHGAEYFHQYCNNNWPFAALATHEGGILSAVQRIASEGRGSIRFRAGGIQEYQNQLCTARKLIEEKRSFFLDGTSAFFLVISGLLDKVCDSFPGMRVPQSVVNLLAQIVDRYEDRANSRGFLGLRNDQLLLTVISSEDRRANKDQITKAIQKIQSTHERVVFISDANRSDFFSEKEILPEFADATILAQKEGCCILTDDFYYLHLNHMETGKPIPDYTSSLGLITEMLTAGLISFEQYLDFFQLLSRFRFAPLPLGESEIKRAIFGMRRIVELNFDNISKLNLPYILSSANGAIRKKVGVLFADFFRELLFDHSISSGIIGKLFAEILKNLPEEMDSTQIGQEILAYCVIASQKGKSAVLYWPSDQVVEQKLFSLFEVLTLCDFRRKAGYSI